MTVHVERAKLKQLAALPLPDCTGLIASSQALRPSRGTIDSGLVRHVMDYRAGRWFAIRYHWHGLAVHLATNEDERGKLFRHLSCAMQNYRLPAAS
jgi:hypothetical protein